MVLGSVCSDLLFRAQVCTFENRPRRTACQMCQAPRRLDHLNGNDDDEVSSDPPSSGGGIGRAVAGTDRWSALAAVRPISAASLMQPARVQSRDMEKLRRREEREARATWSRVVEYCADNQVKKSTGHLHIRLFLQIITPTETYHSAPVQLYRFRSLKRTV